MASPPPDNGWTIFAGKDGQEGDVPFAARLKARIKVRPRALSVLA